MVNIRIFFVLFLLHQIQHYFLVFITDVVIVGVDFSDYDDHLNVKFQEIVQGTSKKLVSEEFKVSSESKLLAGEADEKRMIYFAKRIDKGSLFFAILLHFAFFFYIRLVILSF